MSESKHTPGPWRVANGVNVMADGSRYVAATAGLEDRLRFGPSIETIDALNDEDAANARLIAAAPEMFEALMQCRALFEDDENVRQVIDAALSKAAPTPEPAP